MNRIELLAPVASKEGLRAVINAGADAVYIGGMKFGARAYADNLQQEEMIEAIKYAHLYNVKIYMTINILLKELEIQTELYDYILPYYKAGLDGVIVQDIGVLAYLDEMFPGLEKHASTQMTLVSSECKNLMNRYNVSRIVPARELSLDEIRDIKHNTDLEVEVFIHGALCYCYSGQCLMSSMIGERSGNRGRCAQPCRKQYSVFRNNECLSNNEYILSPKDLCGLENLPYLIKAGVDSLKIEGRMKKIEYGACIVSIYRKYIDLYYKLGHEGYIRYIEDNYENLKKDIISMQDIYNRGGYTKGYFNKYNGKDMMSIKLPSHCGTYVGKVIKVNKRSVNIELNEDINPQDVLQIRDEKFDNSVDNTYEFTVKEGNYSGECITTNYLKGLKLYSGQKVYRIKNNILVDSINENYIKVDKKINLDITILVLKDKPISIKTKLYDKEFVFEYDKPDLSMNRPITIENIEKQFRKISNTVYKIKTLDIQLDDGLFVPVGKLNEIRRDVICKTTEHYVEKYYKEVTSEEVNNRKNINIKNNRENVLMNNVNDNLSILVADINKLEVVKKYMGVNNIKINKIYIELDGIVIEDIKNGHLNELIDDFDKKDIDIYIAMPRIIRKKDINYINNNYRELFENICIKGFLVRNIDSWEYIKKNIHRDISIIMDSNMYVTNSYAAKAWEEYGAVTLTHSLELTKKEICNLNKRLDKTCDNIKRELIVYTRPVVMLSAGCLKKTKDKCNKKDELLIMKDKYDGKYTVRSVCDYCYNIVYNSRKMDIISDADNLAHSYRIEFHVENNDEIVEILNSVNNSSNKLGEFNGHFYKATL